MEISFRFDKILINGPLQNFVHATADVLSWHVQNLEEIL